LWLRMQICGLLKAECWMQSKAKKRRAEEVMGYGAQISPSCVTSTPDGRKRSCFHQGQNFVAGLQFHFQDRAGCNDGRDFPDAGIDNYFTEDFIGHNAFHGSRKLVSD